MEPKELLVSIRESKTP